MKVLNHVGILSIKYIFRKIYKHDFRTPPPPDLSICPMKPDYAKRCIKSLFMIDNTSNINFLRTGF